MNKEKERDIKYNRIRLDSARARIFAANSKEKELKTRASKNKKSLSIADRVVLSRVYEQAGDEIYRLYSDMGKDMRLGNMAVPLYKKAIAYAGEGYSTQNVLRINRKINEISGPSVEELIKSFGLNTILMIFAISSLLVSLFFLYFDLTGFAISNFSSQNFKWVGLGFFVLGLIIAFVFLSKKKRFSKHL
jgi:hypothetical protein